MKNIKLVLVLINLVVASAMSGIVGQVGNGAINGVMQEIVGKDYEVVSRVYAGSYDVTSILRDMKDIWTREEIEQFLADQEETENKLYEITQQLHHFEGKEEDRKLLEQYVDDLKKGKVSVNVDHIIADKITKYLDEHVHKIYYTQSGAKKSMEKELMRAVIKVESTGNPTVVSGSGAMGIAQIMPATAQHLKLDNAFDMEQGIIKATVFMADMLTMFDGNYVNAISAYNAGPNRVKGWLKDRNITRNGVLFNIPYLETKAYTPNVIKYYNAFKGE